MESIMYGEEIRRKVIDLLESGQTQQAVGDYLEINPRTIRNWLHRLKNQGNISPQTHGERQRKINKEALRNYIKENPDKTLKEMSDVFQVSITSIFDCLRKMSITLKKSR